MKFWLWLLGWVLVPASMAEAAGIVGFNTEAAFGIGLLGALLWFLVYMWFFALSN